jgi:CcmD family protein
MTNLAYFIAGYLVIFGLLGGYILRLITLKKRLEKENIELINHSKIP